MFRKHRNRTKRVLKDEHKRELKDDSNLLCHRWVLLVIKYSIRQGGSESAVSNAQMTDTSKSDEESWQQISKHKGWVMEPPLPLAYN